MYLFSWGIFTAMYILNSSLLNINILYKLVSVALCLPLSAIFLLHKSLKLKQIILSLILLITMVIGAIVGNKVLFLLSFLFLINSDRTSFSRILKVSIISVTCMTISVVCLCMIGLLPDYIFEREGGKIAHSLGFSFYYNVSTHILFCSIMYTYVRKTLHFSEILILTLLNYLLYKLCTTRLPFYVYLIFIIAYLVFCKYNVFKSINHKLLKMYSAVAFSSLCILCVVMALKYDYRDPVFFEIDQWVSGRIALSHVAFSRYDIKLFGQYVEMQGNIYGENQFNYFFIDSGYILGLIQYGLLFTICFIVMYSILYYYSCITNDKKLFVWISIVALFNVINGCWTAFVYNPLLFLIIPVIKNMKTIKRKVNINKTGEFVHGNFDIYHHPYL